MSIRVVTQLKCHLEVRSPGPLTVDGFKFEVPMANRLASALTTVIHRTEIHGLEAHMPMYPE